MTYLLTYLLTQHQHPLGLASCYRSPAMARTGRHRYAPVGVCQQRGENVLSRLPVQVEGRSTHTHTVGANGAWCFQWTETARSETQGTRVWHNRVTWSVDRSQAQGPTERNNSTKTSLLICHLSAPLCPQAPTLNLLSTCLMVCSILDSRPLFQVFSRYYM